MVKGDKPWFNLDCKFARQNYRKLKRKKKLYPWQITSEEVNNAEKHYKKTLDSNLNGLILLSFSERSLKLLTFMLSMNSWAFNGFHFLIFCKFLKLYLDCKFARQNYRKLKRKKKIYPWQITSEEVNNAEKHYKTLDSNLKQNTGKDFIFRNGRIYIFI
jgi:hypothetical protein